MTQERALLGRGACGLIEIEFEECPSPEKHSASFGDLQVGGSCPYHGPALIGLGGDRDTVEESVDAGRDGVGR
jgi:hypothetical protein